MLYDREIYCLHARPRIIQPGNVTGWGLKGLILTVWDHCGLNQSLILTALAYEAVLLAFALYLWSYLVLMFMYVCYFTGIFYAVVRQISMLFTDNKISLFCILYYCRLYPFLILAWAYLELYTFNRDCLSLPRTAAGILTDCADLRLQQ